ncbi:hypothetical protein ACOMHN_046107 [Nucella lapillus]
MAFTEEGQVQGGGIKAEHRVGPGCLPPADLAGLVDGMYCPGLTAVRQQWPPVRASQPSGNNGPLSGPHSRPATMAPCPGLTAVRQQWPPVRASSLGLQGMPEPPRHRLSFPHTPSVRPVSGA